MIPKEEFMRRSGTSMDVLTPLNSLCLRWEVFFSRPNSGRFFLAFGLLEPTEAC
jgi:hypothetical protein